MSRKAFSVAVFALKRSSPPKVLVIKHKRLGTWLPIGGEIEEGETPLEAAQRELFEETGMKGVFGRLTSHHEGVPLGFLGYEEHDAGSKGMHMNFVFLCEVSESSKVMSNDEFDHFEWLDVNGLKKLNAPRNVIQFGLDAFNARLV